ncbi:BZ3500_MvSof-1268-A1-R1_Chr10-2g02860 [Microbotryum saponariae]|uniref:BZ3500_MvSof-1268-A1-R1_Chr10-2g02860 protein n=1 Tax=Microbotryum saponariae TaxID=289078 RepID=A0A2X0KA19_9BASI|nr:BZ3501_MvSof-1269-A2-R1_Chr10-2g02446 [Microbotryum saponariae]SDA01633.1 BZ3500_MvSof-1268-A1-R1_Chr10-2g02860 [Microbotryum saponariae]
MGYQNHLGSRLAWAGGRAPPSTPCIPPRFGLARGGAICAGWVAGFFAGPCHGEIRPQAQTKPFII